MEAAFNLPYAEFEAIAQFSQCLRKQDGFGLFIPVSRQQQGIDFLVLNTKSGRTLRVQVKSSRWYEWDKPPIHRFWYNNFVQRYKAGLADLYVFTALYPAYVVGHHVRERTRFWRTTVLVFTDREMGRLLPKIRGKAGKVDRFFQFGFDVEGWSDPAEIKVTRGQLAGLDLTGHLLENRARMLRKMLS